ncbi:hypothetical protein D3P07_25780 [Paenibacillus sp. 1011MAR3C5]|uniref:hypothetical protein n=1 Tax=Paenibacillus sp. 1011MAR3C5 TaxID=1675787 RepID=UPI000E6D09F7|nr:hypothetical protein [Paenibacillus sp. 1011MAR3C5]RJE83044.1 hypothetical protein D3P07_25780 [Paenibacillus sp. 1011MAR3C5]
MRYKQFYIILFSIAAFLLLVSLLWERKGIEEVIAEHELDMTLYSNYDNLYALAADEEQKSELNFLKANDVMGSGVWLREGLIIVGELPQDQRRLTLQAVRDKLETYTDDETLMKQLNLIAGAPDWLGAGDVGRVIYHLNDEGTDSIHFSYGVISYVHQDSNGAEQIELLNKPDSYENKTNVVNLTMPDYDITTNLAEMAKKAELIVEGQYKNKFGTTHRSGNFYSDEYTFVVDRVLFGDLDQSEISISIPSYQVYSLRQDDRLYEAKASGPYFEQIKAGKTYILFLRTQDGYDEYIQACLPFQISFDDQDMATLDFLRTISEDVKITPNGDKLIVKREALGIEHLDRISGMSREQIIEQLKTR